MPIKITIEGQEELIRFFEDLDKEAADVVTEAYATYIMGDQSHGLIHMPYYKYINRYAGFPHAGGFVDASGYKVPPGYFSKKQHKYVMAMIAQGKIKPGQNNRTGNFANSWNVQDGEGRYTISNNTSYGQFLMGQSQTRMHSLIGWRRLWEVVRSNLAGAKRAAGQALQRYINSRK